LGQKTFSALSPGRVLSGDNIAKGSAALNANNCPIYITATGFLSDDADGNGTTSAAVAFVKIELNGAPPYDLSVANFVISN
jgi:hypothetical protein